MIATRRKLAVLGIPAWDAFSAARMDLIAWHRVKVESSKSTAGVGRAGSDCGRGDFRVDDFREPLALRHAGMEADSERTALRRLRRFGDPARSAAERQPSGIPRRRPGFDHLVAIGDARAARCIEPRILSLEDAQQEVARA